LSVSLGLSFMLFEVKGKAEEGLNKEKGMLVNFKEVLEFLRICLERKRNL